MTTPAQDVDALVLLASLRYPPFADVPPVVNDTLAQVNKNNAAFGSALAALKAERAEVVNALGHDEDEYHKPQTLTQTADALTDAYCQRRRELAAAFLEIERLRKALGELAACNAIVKAGGARKVRAGRWAKAWANAIAAIADAERGVG